ncbi:MAG TPA: 4Fe-4S dicluster domain-containing protein [Candidatus Methanomethylophilaceae archaeon]|nr:4Fe-4S dicluster domain-containing protein [Candidatus Methanomethylophilaceae archaeon]
MEGYGFPKLDADKCIGCGSCSLNCPEEVIKVDDRDGWRYIGHSSFNCRTCRICEELCPQDAIEIVHGFDLTQFMEGGVIDDASMGLRACSVCGEAFATDRQLDALKMKLAEGDPEKGVQGVIFPDRIFEICPGCKIVYKSKDEGGKI